VLHTDNGREFTGTVLVKELQRLFPSLRIITGASLKQRVRGCVEQAHNAVYSYLHPIMSFHGDSFNWVQLLPSITYMYNTAVQAHKFESSIFQQDGRVSRLFDADMLVSDEVLHEDEYRRRFDASVGACPDH
jgi:hypothetical protein